MSTDDARGFAPDIARVQPNEVYRQRLVDRLADRWVERLLVLRADGGFGKTVALAQALRDNASDPTGTDVYVACRPYDREARQLARSVGKALDIPAIESEDIDELTAGLVDAVAHLAPRKVCLILDDIQHLGPDHTSTAMLDRLVGQLPSNMHLVLSGRAVASRFVGPRRDGVTASVMQPSELLFDQSELADLARRHAVDVESLASCGGWPAMTRLTVTAPPGTTVDYLVEEVIESLSPALRRALAVTVLGRRVDDEVLTSLALGASVTALSDALPLVTTYPDGTVSAHDLWDEALATMVGPDELTNLGRAISAWHRAGDRIDDAVDVGVRVGAIDEAAAAVLQAIGRSDAFLTGDRVQRWLAAFPPEATERPELQLLRGVTARMAGTAGLGLADSERALAGFLAAEDPIGISAAALEVGLTSWFSGDVGRVLEILALSSEVPSDGVPGIDALLRLGEYALADLLGDTASALAHLDAIDQRRTPDALLALVLRAQSALCLLSGDAHRGAAIADEVLARWPMRESEAIAEMAHWQAGNSSPMRATWEGMREFRRGNHRDDFQHACYAAMVDAGWGIVADVGGLAVPGNRSRELTFLSLARAATLVAAGDEDAAADVLQRHLDAVGVDDPQCRGELRRFITYSMVLSPEAHAALRTDELGPYLAFRRDVAQAVLDARSGRDVDWAVIDDPDGVFCALPLRWSVELAVAAESAGDGRGLRLAEHLVEITGQRARVLLREVARGGGPGAAGAATMLAAVPAEPDLITTVSVCGSLAVSGADATLLRRSRLRQLLALLVLRPSLLVDDIGSLLWPDLGPAQRRNNLRSTLSGVRKLLEPSRDVSDRSFHVRRDGDRMWLHRSEWLDVDLWHMQADLHAAEVDRRAGRFAAAAAAERSAVERWSERVLVDLDGIDEVSPELVAIERSLESAAVRVAQWSVARHDVGSAIAFAERALRSEPYDDRAHGALIGALELAGRREEAYLAARRCVRALADIGVEPSPETALLLRRFAP